MNNHMDFYQIPESREKIKGIDFQGDILKKAKIRKKAMRMTDIFIARKLGIHVNTVRRFFEGDNIGIYIFIDILNVLGMDIYVI